MVANGEEQLKQTEVIDVEVCEEQCTEHDRYPCNESLFQLCIVEMDDNGWNIPLDGLDAASLYILLRNQIRPFI